MWDLSCFFKFVNQQFPKLSKLGLIFLYFQLKELEEQFWPSKEVINEHMPKKFEKKFPNTRVILDATEQTIYKPWNFEAQFKTGSSYKHKNTQNHGRYNS